MSGGEWRVYTVSELTAGIKGTLEGMFPAVWVEGEISNLRVPSSGHAYFTLKDEGAQLSAVLFRGRGRRVRFGRVQGDGAPAEIVQALVNLQEMAELDVIVVGRGGGSIEDLWAFNDETVARAIVACRVPVISAVGHETDFTIADFVADLRAPTPSGAAELVVREKLAVIERLVDLYARLKQAVTADVTAQRERLEFRAP